jgi:NAD+ synthase (glutamine-hydrolysing)
MKIRIVQFSPALGNIDANLLYHSDQIHKAVSDGVEMIVFPELSLSGYQLRDIVYDLPSLKISGILDTLTELSRDIVIVAGLPFEEPEGIFYNSAICFSGGEIIHNHKKVQLPNFGMFEEEMIFKSGDEFRSFRIGGMTAGILICREILFPVNAYLYYLQNTDLIIAVSNSPHRGMSGEGFTSHKLWERLGEVYAVNFHQNFLFCNRTGFEDGIGFGGGSFFAAPGKGIVKMGRYYDEELLDYTINPHDTRRSKISSNYLRDEKPDIILKELKRIIND